MFPCVWSTLTHTLLPSLTVCIQVSRSHRGAESKVTGPGCCCCLQPEKGPISAEGYNHTRSLEKRKRGGQRVRGGENVEIWEPIWKATCSLLGLHLLLKLCCWTCGPCVASGVQSYKTAGRAVCVAAVNESFLSESYQCSTLIKMEILSLFPSVMVQMH